MESEYYSFEGEITSRPITIRDLVEDDRKLQEAYDYLRQITDPAMHDILRWAVDTASDFVCGLCYERRIDPLVLDRYDETYDMIVTEFKPFNFFGQDDDAWFPFKK